MVQYYFEGDVGLLGFHMQVALEMPVIYLLSFGVSLFCFLEVLKLFVKKDPSFYMCS